MTLNIESGHGKIVLSSGIVKGRAALVVSENNTLARVGEKLLPWESEKVLIIATFASEESVQVWIDQLERIRKKIAKADLKDNLIKGEET